MGPSGHAQLDETPTGLEPFQEFLVRRRVFIFIAVAIVHLLAFNGQWRIGRDSACYRGLGHSILTGQGYTWRQETHNSFLPGYPLMLAGMERLFGDDALRPLPQLLMMEAMSALALLVFYRLLLIRFPKWMAVLTTAILGIHWIFLQQSLELMTDIPFLLAVGAALLGHEKLFPSSGRPRRGSALALMVPGLAAAVLLRPTFWPLAIAWGLVGLWTMRRSTDRWRALLSIGILVALVAGSMTFDPRERGGKQGDYERWAGGLIRHNLQAMFHDDSEPGGEGSVLMLLKHHVTEAMFGAELGPATVPVALLVLACAARLGRRNLLWLLLVVMTLLMLAFIYSIARHLLMILPLLLVAWIAAMHDGSLRLFQSTRNRRIFFTSTVGLLIVMNLGKSLDIICEQHGVIVAIGRRRIPPGLERPVSFLPVRTGSFLQAYRNGSYRPLVDLCREVPAQVQPHDIIIGPEPAVMSYLSGRRVYFLPEFHGPFAMPGARPADVKWAVLPLSLYKKYDTETCEFLKPHFPDVPDDKPHLAPFTWPVDRMDMRAK